MNVAHISEPSLENRRSLGQSLSQHPLPTWKRVIDVSLCIVALPVLAFVTLIMTIITRLTSPGPVLFCQERVGYKGKSFTCYKFRTMKVSAETTSHQAHLATLMRSNKPMVKMDSARDKRLIPGAWLLRASGLDELPQILNVLKGEMSLVGPRPCVPYEYREYLPWQMERFNAAPGLTGLWQVSGKNRTTFEEMIRLDIRYSQEKSFFMDVWIISMTIPALVIQIMDTRRGRKSAATAAPATPELVPTTNTSTS